MNEKLVKRVTEEANFIINTKSTIRETAKKFLVSKSTVHKDLQERLPKISPLLSKKIITIVKEHIKIRHIKGGEKTKEKYQKTGA